MARRPSSPFGGLRAPVQSKARGYKPPKPPPPPPPRDWNREQFIRQAIGARATLHIRCNGDAAPRVFEPYVLYPSGTGKVLVGGNQVSNPADPNERNVWRTPEVADLVSVELTGATFTVDPRFSTSDARYKNGVICSVRGF